MIAFARALRARKPVRPAWHAGFLCMLPSIKAQLRGPLRAPHHRPHSLAISTAR